MTNEKKDTGDPQSAGAGSRPVASDRDRTLRWRVYALLILSALVFFGVRVRYVTARDGKTPFLSANDRSRWCGIEALLSEQTYAIDHVIQRKGWDSIDKVSHYGKDGKQHYYSSKPPLFYTLLAGETWVVQRVLGYRLSYKPFLVGRWVVAITNGSFLLIFFLTICCAVERWGETNAGRILVVAVATWGTLLTPFAVSINNHLPGAVAVLVAFYQLLRIWYEDAPGRWRYALCGFAAACAVVCELPALAYLVGVLGALMIKSPRKTLCFALPVVLLVGGCVVGANQAAHGIAKFPYMQRAEGEDWRENNWYNYEGSYWLHPVANDVGEPSRSRYAFHVLIGHHGLFSLTPVWCLSMLGTWLLIADRKHYATALAIIGLTCMCLVFFIVLRPTGDRNYGGNTCGFRWMIWLIPLWLVALIPAADRVVQMPRMRWVALVLLLVSVFSACYPGMNPWTHPWIFQWMVAR